MEYYHIELTPDASKLCTPVLSWGKYEYCKSPMGLFNNPDIFQKSMNELFAGFEEVMAYIKTHIHKKQGNFGGKARIIVILQ
eukprot:9648169-Ditylum_brightwellii.AAC.1